MKPENFAVLTNAQKDVILRKFEARQRKVAKNKALKLSAEIANNLASRQANRLATIHPWYTLMMAKNAANAAARSATKQSGKRKMQNRAPPRIDPSFYNEKALQGRWNMYRFMNHLHEHYPENHKTLKNAGKMHPPRPYPEKNIKNNHSKFWDLRFGTNSQSNHSNVKFNNRNVEMRKKLKLGVEKFSYGKKNLMNLVNFLNTYAKNNTPPKKAPRKNNIGPNLF